MLAARRTRSKAGGPTPAIHGVVRWRIVDLCQWLFEEFRILSETTMSRELRAMSYRKLSARPRHHAQADRAIEELKKLPRALGRNRAGKGRRPARHRDLVRRRSARWPEEQAHEALGKRGSRPARAQGPRTVSTYIFGAICPKEGKGAALVMPSCDTETMNLHLAEIAKNVAPGAHAVLMLDQAGWHMTDRLDVPANITIVPLPPKCPELNPTENIWQFMRDNWLSNRVFKSYDDIVDHCCDAWNKLVDQPWRIMSIGLRDWAHRF